MNFGISSGMGTDGGSKRRKPSPGRENAKKARDGECSPGLGRDAYFAAAFLGTRRSTTRHSTTVMTISTRV